MVRRNTIVGLIIYCMVVSSAFAGTWIDDFEDGDYDGWEITAGQAANWRVEGGECIGEIGGTVTTDLAIGELEWKDYTVEVKVKGIEKLGEPQNWGILARYQNTWHVGAVFALFFHRNAIVSAKWVPDWTIFSDQPFPDFKVGVWYKMKIVANGSKFEVHLDDELIHKFEDREFSSGRVALFTVNMRVHFDNVVITSPGIPDGGPGFAVAPQSKLATMWGSVKRCP